MTETEAPARELSLADTGPLHIPDHQHPPADEPTPLTPSGGVGSLSEWLA